MTNTKIETLDEIAATDYSKLKKVSAHGHRWYVLDRPSSLGENWVVLKRISINSDLRRYGQVASQIDYPKENLK